MSIPKNPNTIGDVNGQKIYGYNEIDIEWFKDPKNIHYICMTVPPRPGCHLFCTILEYKFYPPNTDKNKEFILQIIKWKVDGMEMIYTIVSIPEKEKAYAEAVAKMVGMRIANGVPTMLGGGKPHFFPINVPNAFTIENEPGHPIYSSSHHSQAFEKIEGALCNMIYAGGGPEVENALESLKKGKL